MRSSDLPPEPWRGFFGEIDQFLTQAVRQEVALHCCGGFVATQPYGVARTTSDVDFLGVVPNLRTELLQLGGKGSALHHRHKVYLDCVTVATPPENYESRLVPMYEGRWANLSLFALEAHDVALSKLERNLERDRDDVQQLARAGWLSPEILRERYYRELRPNLLAHEARHDLTLQLWLDSWPA